MKIVIELAGVTCTIEQEVEALPDVLPLIEQALRGVGFVLPEHTNLDLVPWDEDGANESTVDSKEPDFD